MVWNVFVQLPLNSTLTSYMDTILPQIAAVKGIALLTVEPMAGLAAVTTDSVRQLAKYITQYQKVINLDRTAKACQYKIFDNDPYGYR